MGATQSLLSDKGNTSSVKKGVFDKDLVKLNNIVSSIITIDNKFKDSSYNFLNSKTCDRYTMVIENNLHKHLKIHLHDVAQNIFFIPKSNDQIKLNDNSTITKKDICSLISGHYTKTLQILSLIREIYDFENGGDFSMAGIVFRNFKVNQDGMLEVSFCGLEQEPLSASTKGGRIDFKQLKGLDTFVNQFLTEQEAHTFVGHLRELFGSYNKKRISESICKDTIVTPKEYKEIYESLNVYCGAGGNSNSDTNNNNGGGKQNSNLMFKVSKNKPIISYELCFDKQKLSTPLKSKTKQLFNKFKTDYETNLKSLFETLNMLVYYDSSKKSYCLNNLTFKELTVVETKVKQCVIIMFVQSLVNYFKILNHVKQVTSKI
jgi:hypothetical protein